MTAPAGGHTADTVEAAAEKVRVAMLTRRPVEEIAAAALSVVPANTGDQGLRDRVLAELLESGALTGNSEGTPDIYTVAADDVPHLVEVVLRAVETTVAEDHAFIAGWAAALSVVPATPPASDNDAQDAWLGRLPLAQRDAAIAASLRFMDRLGYVVSHPGSSVVPANTGDQGLRDRVLALADELEGENAGPFAANTGYRGSAADRLRAVAGAGPEGRQE